MLDDGEEHGTTYVETDQVFVTKETHEWNHGLGEIVTALLESGMELTLLEEHLSVPWEGLPGMADRGDGEWQLASTGPTACRIATRCRRAAGNRAHRL